MGAILGVGCFLIDIYLAYIIYSDKNAEEYKCKKIMNVNFIFLWLGILVALIARIATRKLEYIDWIDIAISTIITVTICWFLFLKDLYFDLKKLRKDILPYSNEQIKQIRKTYIRNGLFLCFYIIQIIALVEIFD